jgi:hypothetical protein
VLDRIARNTALTCAVIAALAAAWTRDYPVPLGVLGGGLLIGLSYWAIKGTVDALMARSTGVPRSGGEAAEAAESGAKPARLPLVKFFTRHGMLALAAYGMMVRLHLDPVGLLAGVSSLVIAVAVEVLRDLRWRRFP